uniref:Sodium-dependent phosphate transport protein 2A n=1 Tax=Ciona savignyi TaxID=51511 RepID=H2YZA7_CIOSA
FLSNPITGLIIGILVTVIIQSSSTSTTIVIAMVASNVISVQKGIPIVMGANIGTSVTNTAVALTLSAKKEEFRKAFSGATVHDCFNILSVVVLLPLEIVSKYLESLSGAVIRSLGPIEGSGAPRLLRVTKDIWFVHTTEKSAADGAVGGVLFFMSAVILISCLLIMVKVLTSSLKGSFKKLIRKAINTNLPKPFGWLSSYIALFVGCGVTMLIQSSSVVTSTLTPLVGLGLVKLKRMYAVTVGANMGTTLTAVLAALATGNSNALQLAFCHFFFNINGFLLWYPLPFMRRIPMRAAKGLGNVTAKYRWFSVFYVICVFFIIPGIILGLSF